MLLLTDLQHQQKKFHLLFFVCVNDIGLKKHSVLLVQDCQLNVVLILNWEQNYTSVIRLNNNGGNKIPAGEHVVCMDIYMIDHMLEVYT